MKEVLLRWSWRLLAIVSVIYFLSYYPFGAVAPIYGDF